MVASSAWATVACRCSVTSRSGRDDQLLTLVHDRGKADVQRELAPVASTARELQARPSLGLWMAKDETR